VVKIFILLVVSVGVYVFVVKKNKNKSKRNMDAKVFELYVNLLDTQKLLGIHIEEEIVSDDNKKAMNNKKI